MISEHLDRIKESGSALVLAAIAILLLLWFLSDLLLLVFTAILLAIFLSTAVNYIQRKIKASRAISFFIVLGTLLLILGVLVYLFINAISAEALDFVKNFPSYAEALERNIDFAGLGIDLNVVIQSIAGFFSGDALNSVFNAATSFLFIIVLSLFLSFNPEIYKNALLRFVPNKKKGGKMLSNLAHDLRLWLLSLLIGMFIVAIMASVGLLVVGVRFPIILGMIAGFFELVPYFGPFLAFIPAFLVALTQNVSLALYVILLYAIIQVVESYLLVPIINQKVASVSPVYLLIAILVFGKLFGILGVFLAAPILISVKSIYNSVKEK